MRNIRFLLPILLVFTAFSTALAQSAKHDKALEKYAEKNGWSRLSQFLNENPKHALHEEGQAVLDFSLITSKRDPNLYNYFIKKYPNSILTPFAQDSVDVLQKEPTLFRDAQTARKLLGDGAVNSRSAEYSPVLSTSGKTLYFCRLEAGLERVFVSEKVKGTWTTAQAIPELQSSGHLAPVSLSDDGKTLLLFRAGKLAYSEKVDNIWTAPLDFPASINASDWQGSGVLSPNGKYLIFESKMVFDGNGAPSYGGIDLFISEKDKDGVWGIAENMGPVINTVFNERSPFLHSDGRTLYFSKRVYGNLDVFMAKRQGRKWDDWSTPVSLGPAINTPGDDWGYRVSTEGKFAYFAADPEANLRSDIFQTDLPKAFRPEEMQVMKATFFAEDERPIGLDYHPYSILGEFYWRPYGRDTFLMARSVDTLAVVDSMALDSIGLAIRDFILIEQDSFFVQTDTIWLKRLQSDSTSLSAVADSFFVRMDTVYVRDTMVLRDTVYFPKAALTSPQTVHDTVMQFGKPQAKTDPVSAQTFKNQAQLDTAYVVKERIQRLKDTTVIQRTITRDIIEKVSEEEFAKAQLKEEDQPVRTRIVSRSGDTMRVDDVVTRYVYEKDVYEAPELEEYTSPTNNEAKTTLSSAEKRRLEKELKARSAPTKTESVGEDGAVTEYVDKTVVIVSEDSKTKPQQPVIVQNTIISGPKTVRIVDKETGELIRVVQVDPNATELTISIPREKEQIIVVEEKNKVPVVQEITPKQKATNNGLGFDSSPEAVEEMIKTKKPHRLQSIDFEYNSTVLRPYSIPVLQSYSNFINQEKIKVQIHGHTDNLGSEEYNMQLSQKRAQSVVDQLVALGVLRSSLEIHGHGELSPIADNTTEEGRLLNRRVEFVFFR